MDDIITTTSTCITNECPISWIGDEACDMNCIGCAYFYDQDGLFDGGDCDSIIFFENLECLFQLKLSMIGNNQGTSKSKIGIIFFLILSLTQWLYCLRKVAKNSHCSIDRYHWSSQNNRCRY